MRKLSAFVGVLVASLAAASAATAAPYIIAKGIHPFIYVYGFNFPTNGVPVKVSVWWGWAHLEKAAEAQVTPNTTTKPAPCTVACRAGQFYLIVKLPWDPCTTGSNDFLVKTNLYPSVVPVKVSVSCPTAYTPPICSGTKCQ